MGTAQQGPEARYRALAARGEITADPAQQDVVARLQHLHGALAVQDSGGGLFGLFRGPRAPARGLYICGDVGRGKSMLMDLFFETAPVRAKRRVHFHAFMQEIHQRIYDWRQLTETDRRRARKALGLKGASDDPIPPVAKETADQAQLLAFDEFQVNDVGDAMILGRLFEALFGFGVTVVATSNRPPEDLYEDGINRPLFLPFIDLLYRHLDVIYLDAKTDYRLARLAGRAVYFTPLGPEADRAMDAAFRDLTDLDEGAACKLSVKGRDVPVPNQARGVARFTFEALCGRPLGPADYLAIAGTFHTVMVDGIPAMGPDKRNEAKRFVTLIDTLYEAKARFIASAAAAPEALYPSGDGSFEFARTASRIAEMGSAAYLEARDHAGAGTGAA